MDLRGAGDRAELARLARDLGRLGYRLQEQAGPHRVAHDPSRTRVVWSVTPPADPADEQGRPAFQCARIAEDGVTVVPDDPAPARPGHWQVAACKSCHAPVIWGVTTSGDRVCVDEDPVRVALGAADCVLTDRGPGMPPRATVVTNPARLFGKRWAYRRHIATCPYADRYRKLARDRGARRAGGGR